MEGAGGEFERLLRPQVYAESGAVQVPEAAHAFLGRLGQERVAVRGARCVRWAFWFWGGFHAFTLPEIANKDRTGCERATRAANGARIAFSHQEQPQNTKSVTGRVRRLPALALNGVQSTRLAFGVGQCEERKRLACHRHTIGLRG